MNSPDFPNFPRLSPGDPYHALLDEVRRKQMAHYNEWMEGCCRQFMPHTIFFLAKRQESPEILSRYVRDNNFHVLSLPGGQRRFCRDVNGKSIVLATYRPPEFIKYVEPLENRFDSLEGSA